MTLQCHLRNISGSRDGQSKLTCLHPLDAEQEASLAHVLRLITMGEMLAGISHEISQPLFAISNFAAAMTTALEEGTTESITNAKKWSANICQQAARAVEITRRIRDFSRASSPRRSWIEFATVVNESLALLQSEARQHGVQIETNLEAGLPEVLADPIEMQQVLVNLLKNAIEAVEHVIGERQILLRVRREGDSLCVLIRDNGPGIAPEARGELFDSFVTTKEHGLGLGLAVSHTIVSRHGGELSVDDEGPGTTFRITLPVNHQDGGNFQHGDEDAAAL